MSNFFLSLIVSFFITLSVNAMEKSSGESADSGDLNSHEEVKMQEGLNIAGRTKIFSGSSGEPRSMTTELEERRNALKGTLGCKEARREAFDFINRNFSEILNSENHAILEDVAAILVNLNKVKKYKERVVLLIFKLESLDLGKNGLKIMEGIVAGGYKPSENFITFITNNVKLTTNNDLLANSEAICVILAEKQFISKKIAMEIWESKSDGDARKAFFEKLHRTIMNMPAANVDSRRTSEAPKAQAKVKNRRK